MNDLLQTAITAENAYTLKTYLPKGAIIMNPNSDLYTLIQKYASCFTKSEKKVADFILQNARSVVYMSITDLARQCGVGDTTVFRFCKTLRLGGYQNFKMLLAQSSVEPETVITLSDEVAVNDSTNEVFRKLLEAHTQALAQTYQLLHAAEIEQAIECFEKSRLIHFFGVGSSCVTALEAKNKFCRILPNVCFVEDGHMQVMTAALLSPQDLAVAFSYSGSSKDTIEVLRHAKQRGARTICVTHFAGSPITAYADLVLQCGGNEGPFQGGSLSAKIAQLYLIDILYTEFFRKHGALCDENKRLTTQAISERML